MTPLSISAFTATTALGVGNAAIWQAILAGRSGLRRNDLAHCDLDTYIGRVADVEATLLPAALRGWDCRNNRLALLALVQDGFEPAARAALARYGATRVALILGTSTSSMASTEEAYQRRDTDNRFPDECINPPVHAPNSLTGFVADYLGVRGPQWTVATACSSSARVFGSAQRLLAAGVVDAVIVGGVDSLCLSVMYGFHALELMSSTPCRPFDAARNGLNIGEGAGFALLQRHGDAPVSLLGFGESSDAHHMSSPHPEGLGAQQAMLAALQRAALTTNQIDYINLHGTATRMNDAVEAQAIRAVFADAVSCSSTKGFTGHTLGAAGIVEAVVALLSLQNAMVPASLHCSDPEPAMANYLALHNQRRTLNHVMSNSFGFGGNNCSLIFGRSART